MESSACTLAAPTSSTTREQVTRAFELLGLALAAIGLALNVATLCALCAARVRARWFQALLGSLCVADALLAAATLALLSIHLHRESDAHGGHASAVLARDEYCVDEAFRYVWDFSTTANLLTLLVMAVRLFAAARWPQSCGGGGARERRRRSSSAAAVAAQLAAIWLTSAAVALVPAALVMTSTGRHEKLSAWDRKASSLFCYQLVLYGQRNETSGQYKYGFGQASHERAHLLIGLALTVLVLACLTGAYSYVLCVVRRRRRRSAGEIGSQPPPPSSSCAESGQVRRLATVASLVTALFLVCYLPLYTFHTLTSFYGHAEDSLVFAVLMAAVAAAPVADPLLYAMRVREIRVALLRASCVRRVRRHDRRDRVAVAIGSFSKLKRGDADGNSEPSERGSVADGATDHSYL